MKSSPRSTRSPSNSPTTGACAVAPGRMPKMVFRPSSPMPNAATICCPSNGVASISNAFPQPAHHLGHGQDHLHRRISIRGHCLELLHFSLRFNLIWFLHSDSPFLGKRKLLSAYQKASSGESLLSTIYRASPQVG